MRIYLTHCSKEKYALAKETGVELPPQELYTEPGIREFMAKCQDSKVNWAILSDNYGVFLPTEKHAYYEKPPASVTADEELVILRQFEQSLIGYEEIWFYIRPATFHPFYEHILVSSILSSRVHLFQDLGEVN